jgi:hypothetical protein
VLAVGPKPLSLYQTVHGHLIHAQPCRDFELSRPLAVINHHRDRLNLIGQRHDHIVGGVTAKSIAHAGE